MREISMKFISMDDTSSVAKLLFFFFLLFNFSEIRVHLVIDVRQVAVMIELSFAVLSVLADGQNQILQIGWQQHGGELEMILENYIKPLKSNDSK